MEAGTGYVAALNSADLAQETVKVHKTFTTRDRNALRRRIEAAVDRIRAAGVLQFHRQPATAALFAALVPPKGASRGGADQPPPPASGKQ